MESESINDVLKNMIFLHYIFIIPLPIIYIFNLYVLFRESNYARLNKKIWYGMPMIFLLLSISLLTGLSIWAMQQFQFHFSIIFMCFVFCFLLGSEIYRIKNLKRSRIAEEKMQKYISFCKKNYFINLCLLLIIIGYYKL
ncbi:MULTISPECIES: hypothetical protein [unclassified Helicobacter]|uniref:hypothetical protein n=1 Tax=unclassified Helicobacter TaxID=2593540 RepID=UPI000CF190DE|nr:MULTISPECIES: hypothetical protein [unclassified Helicobacter]